MSQLSIKLGPFWSRFCRPTEDLELLGTVEQGPGIGALARSSDGCYWQVNGDVRRKLNTSRIEAGLRGVSSHRRVSAVSLRRSEPPVQRATPVVVVKRRRVLERPT